MPTFPRAKFKSLWSFGLLAYICSWAVVISYLTYMNNILNKKLGYSTIQNIPFSGKAGIRNITFR